MGGNGNLGVFAWSSETLWCPDTVCQIMGGHTQGTESIAFIKFSERSKTFPPPIIHTHFHKHISQAQEEMNTCWNNLIFNYFSKLVSSDQLLTFNEGYQRVIHSVVHYPSISENLSGSVKCSHEPLDDSHVLVIANLRKCLNSSWL